MRDAADGGEVLRGMLAGIALLTTHTGHPLSLILTLTLFLSLPLSRSRALQAVKTIFRLAFQAFYGFISTKILPLNTQIVACHSWLHSGYHIALQSVAPCTPVLSSFHPHWLTVNSLPCAFHYAYAACASSAQPSIGPPKSLSSAVVAAASGRVYIEIFCKQQKVVMENGQLCVEVRT